MNSPTPAIESESTLEQDFLVEAATTLHKYGTPAYRLERVMQQVAAVLSVEAEFLYTPTSLLVSFKRGWHRTRLQRIEPGDADLGKLIEFDTVLDQLEAGKINCAQARQRMLTIDSSRPRFGLPAVLVAALVASAAATVFLGGGLREAGFAGVVGVLIQLWGNWLHRRFPQEHLLEITAGFFSAGASIAVGYLVPGFDQSTACLGSLIILVPGFSFTVSLAELANRHLSCGVARMAGAAVVFLALVCGVALAWRLGAPWRLAAPPTTPVVPMWLYVGAILIAPFSFAVLFQARIQEWPIIVVVAWCGLMTAVGASILQGNEFGAFAGALVLGALANLVARVLDRPATVAQMPATLMLVPGSLGYRSLTAFVDHKGMEGVESAFAMAIIAIAIVGGLLTSNLIVPPRRIL